MSVLVKVMKSATQKQVKKPEVHPYFESIDSSIIPDHVFEQLRSNVEGNDIESSLARIRHAMKMANHIGELSGDFSRYIEVELKNIEEVTAYGRKHEIA